MKFSIFLTVFLAQSLWVFSQTRRISDEEFSSSGAINLMFVTSKQEAMDLAIKDINQELPFIFIQSGEVPIVYETDIAFESKYRAYYYEQGCLGPDMNLMIEYNKVIFDYLSRTYKNKWQAEIRLDVIGLQEWKQSKKPSKSPRKN